MRQPTDKLTICFECPKGDFRVQSLTIVADARAEKYTTIGDPTRDRVFGFKLEKPRIGHYVSYALNGKAGC